MASPSGVQFESCEILLEFMEYNFKKNLYCVEDILETISNSINILENEFVEDNFTLSRFETKSGKEAALHYKVKVELVPLPTIRIKFLEWELIEND